MSGLNPDCILNEKKMTNGVLHASEALRNLGMYHPLARRRILPIPTVCIGRKMGANPFTIRCVLWERLKLFPAGATRTWLLTNDARFVHVARANLAVVRVKKPTLFAEFREMPKRIAAALRTGTHLRCRSG